MKIKRTLSYMAKMDSNGEHAGPYHLHQIKSYNEQGELIREDNFDFNGQWEYKKEYAFQAGKLIAEREYYDPEAEVPDLEITFEFDAAGNEIQEQVLNAGELLKRTVKEYDHSDQLQSEQVLNDRGVVIEESTFEWDGQLLRSKRVFDPVDQTGSSYEYSYNRDGLRTGEDVFDQDGNAIWRERWFHSDKGVLISSDNGINRSEFDYDHENRLVGQKDFDQEGNLVRFYTYAYNQDNQLCEMVFFEMGSPSELEPGVQVRDKATHLRYKIEYEYYPD